MLIRKKILFSSLSFSLILIGILVITVANSVVAKGKKDVLVVALESGPNGMDLHAAGVNRPGYGLFWNVYDRLLTYGVKTAPNGDLMYDYTVLAPELAESWKVSQDGKSITFKLRKDATFHDGTAVTAEDVKWSFDRAVSVGGFASFQMRAGSLEKPEQFEAVDRHTFRIHLLRKDKLTLPDIAVPVPAIFNSKVVKKHITKSDPWGTKWTKTHVAGGGAFMIETWKPKVRTVYKRFDDWKSGPLPEVKRVIALDIPSASTRRAMLERGDVDMSFDLPPKDVSELAEGGKMKVVGVPIENFSWSLEMNVNMKPFDNMKVRQAVAYAVPYQKIMDAAFYGRALPLYGGKSFSPATVEWPQPSPYTTDLNKAKKLLQEAGYANGFQTTLTINIGKGTVSEPMALLIQESLSKLAITVKINKVPGSNFRGAIAKKNLPMLLNDFGGWLNYPDYYFFWAYYGNTKKEGGKPPLFNTMAYADPVMDALIDQARVVEYLSPTYNSLAKAFIEKAFVETPRVPIAQAYLNVAMQKNVVGYQYWFHRQVDFRQIAKK